MNKNNYYGEHRIFESYGYDAEYRGEVKRVVHAYWIEREKNSPGDVIL